jgi:hypothetical protein
MFEEKNIFDDQVREKLSGLELPFQPEDWQRLKTKMKENKKKRILLWFWISAVFLLFSVGSFAFYLSADKPNHLPAPSVTPKSSEEHTLSRQSDSKNNQPLIQSDNQKSEQKDDLINKKLAQPLVNNYAQKRMSTQTQITNVPAKESNQFNSRSNSNLQEENATQNLSTPIVVQNGSRLIEAEIPTRKQKEGEQSVQQEIPELVSYQYLLSCKKIETVQVDSHIRAFNSSMEENKASIVIKNKFAFPRIYKRSTHLILWAGGDMNWSDKQGDAQIGSSFAAIFDNDLNDRFSLRYGILYSYKSFSNSYEEVIDRMATEGMTYNSKFEKKTNYHFISIPFLLQVVILSKDKWCFSTSAGFMASLLFDKEVTGTQRTTVYQNAGSVTSITELHPDSEGKAAFEGGNLSDNMYLGLYFGFNAERKLSDRLDLFFQTYTQIGVTGLGQNKEHLYNFGINIGLKTKL